MPLPTPPTSFPPLTYQFHSLSLSLGKRQNFRINKAKKKYKKYTYI